MTTRDNDCPAQSIRSSILVNLTSIADLLWPAAPGTNDVLGGQMR
jgi:hypothetical protein